MYQTTKKRMFKVYHQHSFNIIKIWVRLKSWALSGNWFKLNIRLPRGATFLSEICCGLQIKPIKIMCKLKYITWAKYSRDCLLSLALWLVIKMIPSFTSIYVFQHSHLQTVLQYVLTNLSIWVWSVYNLLWNLRCWTRWTTMTCHSTVCQYCFVVSIRQSLNLLE